MNFLLLLHLKHFKEGGPKTSQNCPEVCDTREAIKRPTYREVIKAPGEWWCLPKRTQEVAANVSPGKGMVL